MAERIEGPVDDPFGARSSRVAAIAKRVGCTEGQAYSVVIGVLLLWMVSANGLPDVVWHRSGTTADAVRRTAPAASEREPSRPSPGLLLAAPSPVLSPVTTQSSYVTSPDTPPPVGATSGGDDVSQRPLRVVEAGYASASAGTPLATIGVPDGSVAVTRRAGRTEDVAYLRLDGEGPTLDLAVDANGANTLDTLAGLWLCPVTDASWKVGQGDVTPDKAPKPDCSRPVTGVRSASGDRWTFDVRSLDFGAITGVALVPASDAMAPEFQVVFRPGGASEG